MAKVISFMNVKSGVGTTISAYAIGSVWAAMGKKILFVDLDPQADLTTMLSEEDPFNIVEGKTVTDAIMWGGKGGILQCIKHTGNPLIDYVPADLDLTCFDDYFKNFIPKDYLLADTLEPIKSDYDIIILDCAPMANNLTHNALVASDYLAIVSSLDAKSYKGLKMTALMYNKLVSYKRPNPSLKFMGIICTMYYGDKVSMYFWDKILKEYSHYVIEPHIRKSALIALGDDHKHNLNDIDLSSNAYQDYIPVAQYMMVRMLEDLAEEGVK